MKPIIFFAHERCLGCRSCEIGCSLVHSKAKNLLEAIAESPLPEKRVTVESLKGIPVPILCRHCEGAPCIQVCPTKAMKRHSLGPVVIERELCVGCSSCIIACPWGVPKPDREGKVVIKCDFCAKELEKGGKPACVISCPTRALSFGCVEEKQYLK